MKTKLFTLALLSVLAYMPNITHAGEIHYGFIIDQKEDTLLLEYKSPAGARFYTCDIENEDCDKEGSEEPDLFESALGTVKNYVKSADGTLAIRTFALGTRNYYVLYKVQGDRAIKKALLPYFTPGAKVYFAKNNNAVIFKDGTLFTRYDIASKKVSSVTLDQNLSFLSISPNATYVTGYNYGTLLHELWSFSDGKMTNGPSAMQSYMEFSEDESEIAFLEDEKSFKTLYTMSTRDLGKENPSSLTKLTKPETEVEDYLYIDDTLFFMANVDGPLEWDLFAYKDEDTELVEEDVSYGDFLKRIRHGKESYLAYLKTNDKNTDIYLISGDLKDKKEFTPVRNSSLDSSVKREVVEYGDRNGVLISPKREGTKKRDLFIWMHGGPQRQVAKEYHPYLSYAVYDEMLERLAAGGSYVYKIDYTGSSGYGADFRKALSMKIGDIEMKDIRNAIEDIQDDKRIDNVYLIGNSYGGYMAFRGIVDIPQEIDGAISINGVSDWYGLIQQIPSSPFKKLFNGVPDDHNLDEYFQASVFLGMENLTSRDKILVVWGEEDSTVPVWQSTKYVEYAEEQDLNVSTLSFPEEDHIIRKRENLDTLCDTIVDTFNIDGVECKL